MRERITLAAAIGIGVSSAVFAQDGAATMGKPGGDIVASLPHDPTECAPDGIAVGGYDLLSYRTEGGPRLGSAQFAADHGAFTYLFETAENRRRFEADPLSYLPAYGGWCATTLALGRLTCPDYTNFKLEDGELLLFELTGFTNGQTLWNADPGRYRGLADRNYDVVLSYE